MIEKITIERETPICPHCNGSGDVRSMTNHLGPDDYEFDESCPACNGTGSADVRDAINALGYWEHKTDVRRTVIERAAVLRILDARQAALAAQPAEPVAHRDAALNTLAQVFHNGEEAEGDDGAVMIVDLALWNEGCEALESLVGEDDAAPPAPAADERLLNLLARIHGDGGHYVDEHGIDKACVDADLLVAELHATHAAVPLTDEQIHELAASATAPEWQDKTPGWHMGMDYLQFARAIERAHDIGDKP